MKLLVVDSNSIVNRAFYGIKLLTTRSGQYTNAITGFLNILLKLQTDTNADEIALAFDLKAPTFRHEQYSGYKANRKGMPEELAAQMPVLKELLTLMGFKIISAEGFEADDILGTLANACEQRGDVCVLATGDRDSLQLVSEKTHVLLATTQMGKSVTNVMDIEAIKEKYGVMPQQLIDVKSLMGDASDNIPGVAGVGEKTALSLIQNFKSLDGVYENIENSLIKKGAREKLLKDKQNAYLSLELARIIKNAPVPTENGAYKRSFDAKNLAAAARLLQSLEMYTTIKKWGLNDVQNFAGEGDSEKQAPAKKLDFVEAKVLPQNFKEEKVYICMPEPSEDKQLSFEDMQSEEQSADNILIVENSNIYTISAESEEFINLLCDESIKKYCFEAKPLYHLALKRGKTAKGIVFDAKIAAYLLQPDAKTYTALQLAQSYGVKPLFEAKFEEAAIIKGLCDELCAQCEQAGMSKLLNEIELPLCEVLADMEHEGIQVNKKGIEDFGVELQAALKIELAKIYEVVGYEFNVNSPKQLAKALYEDMGLPTGKKTKSGYSTNAETLEYLKRYSPVIENILQYRTYQKLNSTYVEGLLKVISEDGRIHSTFNQTETRTGRISSGEPNMQNIPVRTELGSRFRKYFTAPQGKVLLDADYSQIELRILAHISEDEGMIDAFNRGADIHRSTAAKSFGVSEEDVTAQMRSSAKAVNFGIVYGISAFSLSKDIHVSVKEADAFIKTYFENFPGVKFYLDKTVAKAKEDGFVSTLYARRRNLPELANSNFNVRSLGERMAMNTPIQGTAADIIKLAMVRVYSRLKKENLKAKLILQVHDELIVECDVSEKQAAQKVLLEEMQGAMELCVPLSVDVNSGQTWYDAKG